MKFFEIFKDKNDYNEKTIIGAASFVIMAIIAMADTVMGILGKTLTINEYIFNSFVVLTLGSFGIAEVGKVAKIFGKKSNDSIIDQVDDATDTTEEQKQ